MPIKLNFFKSYTIDHIDQGKIKKRFSLATLVSGIILVALISYVLYTPKEEVISDYSLQEGDIVKDDIVIKKDISIIDKEKTEKKRKEATDKIEPVYEYWGENETKTRNLVNQWFQLMREYRKEYIKNPRELPRLKERLARELGLEVPEDKLQNLFKTDFFSNVDLDGIQQYIKSLYDKRIVNSLTAAQKSTRGTIKLAFPNRPSISLKLEEIYDLKSTRVALAWFVKRLAFTPSSETITDFITSQLMEFIDINISYSKNLTAAEERGISESIDPVMIKLKADKIILRKGDEVKPEDMRLLRLISSNDKSSAEMISAFYLIAIIICFLGVFGRKFYRIWITGGINRDKIFLVTSTSLILSALVYRGSLFLFPLILKNTSLHLSYDINSIYFAIPFGFSVLVIAFVFNLQSAVIFSFVNALFGGIICEWDFKIFLYILLGNLAVSYGIEYYQRLKRSPIIKASLLWLMPINIVLIMLFQLTNPDFDLRLLSLNVLMGVFSALISPILANFLIPVWESIFRLVTELKLVEITNQNLPIFREMLEKAPGTYHHSLMVASLSEATAQDLGLSSQLVRAMALYHDIGKVDNPHFFTENHTIYLNPHDNLPPRDSAKNIISHIPDGLERANKIKLPPMVLSAISQHHGTKLVRYFYDKAREMSSVDSEEFDNKVFRYPGEKPQSIENAVIMLADQVEAASKSLAAPTDEEIKNVIRKIIDANIEENQFDECEGLTFKALQTIANSFFKKLSSIYHMRISYPGFDFKERDDSKPLNIALG